MIHVETNEQTTSHRRLAPAMLKAAELWKKGATHVFVSTDFASYRIERTADGIFGNLQWRGPQECMPNPFYWQKHSQAVGLPTVAAGAFAYLEAANAAERPAA